MPYSRHIRYILSKVVKCSHLFMVSTFPERQNSLSFPVFLVYYRPQRSCEDYVFTGMSVHWGLGVSASVHAGIPYPQEQKPPPLELTPPPPTEQTPREQTPPRDTATAADGTHPTGMHSSLIYCFSIEHFIQSST